METFYKTLLWVCLALLLSRIETSGTEDPIKATLQATLDNYGDSGYFTGLQFSYLPHGTDKVFTSTVGFTSQEKTQPVTDDNLFGWGSITKEFLNAVLFKLQGEGKVSLTSTVFEELPEYFDSSSEGKNSWPDMWKDIILYQMLNMTSGIPDFFGVLFLGIDQGKYKSFVHLIEMPWTLTEIVDLASNFQHAHLSECQKYNFCFEPGTSYKYSNTDYIILAILVEKLTGESVVDLFNSVVYPHLPSDGIAYYEGGVTPQAILDQMAQGYGDTKVIGLPNVANGTKWPFYLEGPAGGMIGNTTALVTLLKALYGGKIVGESLTSQFLNDYLVNITTGQLVKDPTTECGPQHCYGLGIMYQYSSTYGAVYFYEGRPFAYGTVYLHLPCYDLTLGLSKNSASNDFQVLMENVFAQLENLKTVDPDVYQTEVNPSFCPQNNRKPALEFLSGNGQVQYVLKCL